MNVRPKVPTGDVRALAVDLGTKRVGLAVSDSLGIAATPIDVLEGLTPEQVADRVAAIAKDRGVGVLVVGMPFNMDGSDHKTAPQIRQKAELCGKRSGLPIEYVDERLTTVEAARRLWESGLTNKNRKSRVDQVAAALILQSWLESRRAAKRRAEIAAMPPEPDTE
ncbi:MAG: Holliday junction resolvase RuvX [Planctomycetes bacterium]|nr:Holliday junction resolvase RuvX [Planctomycetota bacterium]